MLDYSIPFPKESLQMGGGDEGFERTKDTPALVWAQRSRNSKDYLSSNVEIKMFTGEPLVSDTDPMLQRLLLSVTLSTGGRVGGKCVHVSHKQRFHIAEQVKTFATNPDGLSFILRTHMEGRASTPTSCPLLFLAKSLSFCFISKILR